MCTLLPTDCLHNQSLDRLANGGPLNLLSLRWLTMEPTQMYIMRLISSMMPVRDASFIVESVDVKVATHEIWKI